MFYGCRLSIKKIKIKEKVIIMKKKILSLACASLGLAIPLSACTPAGNTDDKWWSTEGELVKNGEEIVFNDVSLRLYTLVAGEDKTAFNQLIAQFNREYSGKISISVSTEVGGSFEDYFAQSIKNNLKTAPDIVMAHQNSLKSFVGYKLVQPLDEAMEETGVTFDLNAFSTGINQYSNADTDYNFGVPADAASMVVYYNKELLARYSETVPSNREELIEVCEAYANATKSIPISWATGGDFFAEYIMPTAIYQNGGYLYKDDLRVDWYDNAEQREIYKNAIASVREFVNHTPKLAEKGVSDAGALKAFRENKALFYVGMPWNLESICEGYAAENGCTAEVAKTEKIGATSIEKWFALDSEKDYANKIYCDSHAFSLTSKVKDITQKAAVLEFIKWFTTRGDVGAAWAEAGHISISNAINGNSEYTENLTVNQYINKWYPDINALNTMGSTPYYADLAKSMRSILSEGFLANDDSGDEALIRSKQNEFNSNIDWVEM